MSDMAETSLQSATQRIGSGATTLAGQLSASGFEQLEQLMTQFPENEELEGVLTGAALDTAITNLNMAGDLQYESAMANLGLELTTQLEEIKTGNQMELIAAEGTMAEGLLNTQGTISGQLDTIATANNIQELNAASQANLNQINQQGAVDINKLNVVGQQQIDQIGAKGDVAKDLQAQKGLLDKELEIIKGDLDINSRNAQGQIDLNKLWAQSAANINEENVGSQNQMREDTNRINTTRDANIAQDTNRIETQGAQNRLTDTNRINTQRDANIAQDTNRIETQGAQNRLTDTNRITTQGEQNRLTDTNRITTQGSENRKTDTNRLTVAGKQERLNIGARGAENRKLEGVRGDNQVRLAQTTADEQRKTDANKTNQTMRLRTDARGQTGRAGAKFFG